MTVFEQVDRLCSGAIDTEFTDKNAALRFKNMAEEDGTYWGWQEKRRVVL